LLSIDAYKVGNSNHYSDNSNSKKNKLINRFVIKISVDGFLLALNSSSDATQVCQPKPSQFAQLVLCEKKICALGPRFNWKIAFSAD
jgi:hypothetical protein